MPQSFRVSDSEIATLQQDANLYMKAKMTKLEWFALWGEMDPFTCSSMPIADMDVRRLGETARPPTDGRGHVC